jgi:hypothetical protein
MLTFDHIIIVVDDLDSAIADYQSLGFNAFFGGEHASGETHNALIVFADGSYLELLALTEKGRRNMATSYDPSGLTQRFSAGEGFAGYAFQSDQLESDVTAIQSRGLALSAPVANGRLRPDGERLAWRAAFLDGSMSPFFITDDTPRVLRVPDDPDKTAQPNGVTGVAGLVVAHPNLQHGVDLYTKIFGVQPQTGTPIDMATTADFPLAGFTLTVAAPASDQSPLTNHLNQRGSTPYQLACRTTDPTQTGLLDLKKAHNAQIRLQL